jgi:hypothetical protein
MLAGSSSSGGAYGKGQGAAEQPTAPVTKSFGMGGLTSNSGKSSSHHGSNIPPPIMSRGVSIDSHVSKIVITTLTPFTSSNHQHNQLIDSCSNRNLLGE